MHLINSLQEHSGFLDRLHPGDLILANHGFTIEDSVCLYCARICVPPFTKGRKQLTRCEVDKAREISHVRIHVERVTTDNQREHNVVFNTGSARYKFDLHESSHQCKSSVITLYERFWPWNVVTNPCKTKWSALSPFDTLTVAWLDWTILVQRVTLIYSYCGRIMSIGFHYGYEVIKNTRTRLPTIGSLRRQQWAVSSLFHVAEPRDCREQKATVSSYPVPELVSSFFFFLTTHTRDS